MVTFTSVIIIRNNRISCNVNRLNKCFNSCTLSRLAFQCLHFLLVGLLGTMLKMWSHLTKKNYKWNKNKKYENLIDVCESWLSKLIGVSVYTIKCVIGNIVVTKFSPFGFRAFILYIFGYFYSIYVVIVNNQTVILKYYYTKL